MDNSIAKLGNKVDDSTVNRAKAGDTSGNAPSGKSAAVSGETVELTSGGQLLSRLEASLKAAPSVDSAKVADIKAAIAEGNYEINSAAIADAMLRFERGFGE
jgi:negative regulator of flagellin synthesis FlgM